MPNDIVEVNVTITGTRPLLMHRYVFKDEKEAIKKSGTVDYSNEWKTALYHDERTGQVFSPSDHILGAIREASKNFKIPGNVCSVAHFFRQNF
ncbi:MAG: hypothetical protein KAS32_09230 [Candidatus Peribacteraceae bacterium]|nr:hypothetical protein [Candidatus Peribacteraceae bacterium]